MANEAFALSPISARATQPSEEDYDAIREAFMETSRGRWFLGEYAIRNRNADTRMVLDAVARIEDSLAAQKPPPPDNRLADALLDIKRAVNEARAAATAILDGQALEENLTPVRRGMRIIKEISWRWREIGGDGRICDLLDSQVSAIEGACEKIVAADTPAAVDAAFDAIGGRIAAFDGGDLASAPKADETPPPPSPPPTDEIPEAVATNETAGVMADAADGTADPATSDGYEAQDEAVLDLIALEMAASDPADPDEYPAEVSSIENSAFEAAAPAPAKAEITKPMPDPIEAPVATHAALPPSLQPSPRPTPLRHPVPVQAPRVQLPPEQPSLGSSLLASGIVRRPKASGSDPMAAIRRLSQAEKIALFS